MYSWSKDFPTLTELFFGRGNGPTGKIKSVPLDIPKKKSIKKELTTEQQTN